MSGKMNIRKIAKLAGCSPSTVSRVLSGKTDNIQIGDKTRENILAICREHDYTPSVHAARFFSSESKMIGFIIPKDIPLEDDNLARSMSSLYMNLRTTGYRFLPIVYDQAFADERGYLALFKRKEIDAAIIWGNGGGGDWLDEMSAEKLPFMLLTNREKAYPSISCDDAAGMSKLVAHCLERGAKKLACVALPSGECASRRLNGFLDAAKGVEHNVFTADGIGIDSGERIADQLMKDNPDAILCCNDRLAIGIEKKLIASGKRIPNDVMVTGADNIELSCYCPVPLTTFDQMAETCAQHCTEIILAHLKDGSPLKSAFIAPEIIYRVST